MTPVSAIISQLQLCPQAAAAYQQLLQQLYTALSRVPRPAVVGISGAQGSGKTTLAKALAKMCIIQGITAGTVSLDDYYLSKTRRQQLAQHIHPLLAQRGVPGSHHIEQAIADANAVLAGKPVTLPQFDKALDQPAASLAPQQLDILIVEGWCIGVQPQTTAELMPPVNVLEATEDADRQWRSYVNERLTGRYADYWHVLKPLIWLQAPDWDCVCRWRAQQEQQLWQNRGNGLNETDLARFMLPFQRLTLASWQQLPAIADITVLLDQQHTPSLVAAD